MKTKSTLLCFALTLYVNIHTVNAQVNKQDSLALIDLYNSTNGAHWFIHTNWLTLNPLSRWYGITVTGRRVTAIHLDLNNLQGSIPLSIGTLINLNSLDLANNQLSGSIPSSLGNLVKLIGLGLLGNQLTGSIPSSVGNLVNLQTFLDLRYNQLTGSIPSSIGKLVNLGFLALTSNQLSGKIPSSIGNLVNLETLDFAQNQLSGNIPSVIGNLVNLQWLALNNNKLSSGIPSSIGKLVNLQNLFLGNNQLSGSIPASIGNLSNLYGYLYLSNNKLSGAIPSSLKNLTHLNDAYGLLDLSHNYFTFDGMELIAKTFPLAIYDHQKRIPILQHGNTLSVSAGGTLSNNKYKWYMFRKEGDTIIIKGDSVFHPTQNGKYLVRVKNSVATELTLYSDSIVYIAPDEPVVTSAENELQQADKINAFLVYPNPAKDMLHIQGNGKATFSLIDESGKTLLTKTVDGKAEINVSNLPAGLYYLKNIQTGEVKKVIISR